MRMIMPIGLRAWQSKRLTHPANEGLGVLDYSEESLSIVDRVMLREIADCGGSDNPERCWPRLLAFTGCRARLLRQPPGHLRGSPCVAMTKRA